MPVNEFAAVLRAFAEANIDFIVVGGVAAVLNGVAASTFDVDVVHARDGANVARLLPVLDSLDAIFSIQPERRLKPAESHLSGPGHLNLKTRYGSLDVLGTIGDNLSYQDLLPHSTKIDIGEGVYVQVLDLETIIQIKEQLHRDKDLAMLPLLRRTLAEKNRG